MEVKKGNHAALETDHAKLASGIIPQENVLMKVKEGDHAAIKTVHAE
jgi:hypothetical protein